MAEAPTGAAATTASTSHVAFIEAWLSSEEFEPLMAAAYSKAKGGTGSNDRNISPGVLEAVISELHELLPQGLGIVRLRPSSPICPCYYSRAAVGARSQLQTRTSLTRRFSRRCRNGSRCATVILVGLALALRVSL